jgi:hypothetical protein
VCNGCHWTPFSGYNKGPKPGVGPCQPAGLDRKLVDLVVEGCFSHCARST